MTLAQELAPEITKRRAAGESYRQIMRELDVSRGTVSRALKVAGELVSNELITPEAPAGESCSPPLAPTSSDSRAEPPSLPTERYGSRFASFISEVREVLRGESHGRTRQTIEALVSDLEARSAQNLRALDRHLARQRKARQARPEAIRRSLESLGRRKVKAEARVRDAEAAVDAETTDRGRRAAERQLAYDRGKLADIEKVMAWRKRELESAVADAEAA